MEGLYVINAHLIFAVSRRGIDEYDLARALTTAWGRRYRRSIRAEGDQAYGTRQIREFGKLAQFSGGQV
jgi:hypothetical protein